MGDKLCIEAKVGAMSFDLLTDQRTKLATGQSLLLVDLSHHLLVRSQYFGSRNPGIVGTHHRSPSLILLANVLTENEGTLVLVRVLELSSRVNANDTALSAINLVNLVHCLLILIGDDFVGPVH